MIYLKNGKHMEGEIISEDEKTVWLEMFGGKIGIKKSNIKQIDKKKSEYTQTQVISIEGSEVSAGEVYVRINPMIELDFKSKEEIYELRRKYVLEYPELFDGQYQPSQDVFGQIESERPWWGILGLSYYGDGEQSIEGPSEESRFIANPFLLVGITEASAHRINNKKLEPEPVYPKPSNLIWDKQNRRASVRYDTKSFFSLREKFNYQDDFEMELIAYNARDLGYNYLYVVLEESKNIDYSGNDNQAVIIRQFIHLGGSCGYPGGGNNMSPYQPELIFKVKALPAYLLLKLWKSQPPDVSQEADMSFEIEMR
ncbi:MAG: hypothetical protein HY810_03925 [Candidatus Omnitrophica bacterium]|nr:hypothetical protein [Candidatus Omnitrophota bacterium]